MSLHNSNVEWVRRGRQRAALVRALRRPMTASELCRAAQPVNPRIQLRDVWFLMGQLRDRRLVVCLNPKHTTGKLYTLTPRGRAVASEAFGIPISPPPNGIHWATYAKVVRARVRKLVLLELARLPYRTAATATVIRKRLRAQHAIALNPALRALKDLNQLGLVHAEPASESDRRWVYRLTPAGQRTSLVLQHGATAGTA